MFAWQHMQGRQTMFLWLFGFVSNHYIIKTDAQWKLKKQKLGTERRGADCSQRPQHVSPAHWLSYRCARRSALRENT